MPTHAAEASGTAEHVFETLPYVSLAGLGLLSVNLMLSFEKPHTALLGLAGVLLLVAPVAVLVRLTISSEFSHGQRKAWLRGLAGRNGAHLFVAFFSRTARARESAILIESDRRGG